jgi:hypothetical protein
MHGHDAHFVPIGRTPHKVRKWLTTALRAELARLPDQDRARPDPVYRFAALRKT